MTDPAGPRRSPPMMAPLTTLNEPSLVSTFNVCPALFNVPLNCICPPACISISPGVANVPPRYTTDADPCDTIGAVVLQLSYKYSEPPLTACNISVLLQVPSRTTIPPSASAVP